VASKNLVKVYKNKGFGQKWKTRKLSVKTKRIFKRISITNNKFYVPQVTREFISGCSDTISASIVRRILKRYGIHGYGNIRKPFLTITQKRKSTI